METSSNIAPVRLLLRKRRKLHPIEGVWAIAKNKVARSGPHSNLLDIRNKLLHAFNEKITSKVIVGFWKRALAKAKEYQQSDNNVILLDVKMDDDDEF